LVEPAAGVKAAIAPVEGMDDQGMLSANTGINAGSVIERDVDVLGRRENLASRMAPT
jgi:class 3 adenylate cyclase